MVYPFPVTVTFQGTVTLNRGTAHIQYFTDAGASLSGIFPPETVALDRGQAYSFKHKVDIHYAYVGYKKSTVSQPSGGSVSSGDPPGFTYDGSFTDVWINFYYHADSSTTLPTPAPTSTPEPTSSPTPTRTDNHDPVFEAGWFKEYNRYGFKPDVEVVVGDRVNLRVIYDPSQIPEHPYDPDGDLITYTWDFSGSSSAWVRKIGTDQDEWNHDEGYYNIEADTLGYHCVDVTATDPFGGSATRKACIDVVPPNPIARIQGPTAVVEGRPLPEPFDGSQSYSPAGRTIVQYIWGNKQEVYRTPGTEIVTLDVVDSGGLKSLAPASHTLTVRPDLPPMPQAEYVHIGLRNVPIPFKDTSYSPDHDTIVEHTDRIVCDTDNDGSFADEQPVPVQPDDNGEFSYTPAAVGNCQLSIHLKEDWGKTADGELLFTVVNQQPQADFSVKGTQPLPPEYTTVAPTASQLLDWSASSIGAAAKPNDYRLGADLSLQTRGLPFISPYKGITGQNVTLTMLSVGRSEYNRGCCGYDTGYNHPRFSWEYRIDKHLWTQNPAMAGGGPNGYRMGPLYNEDDPKTGSMYDPWLFPQAYNDEKVEGVNAEQDMIWVRRYPYSYEPAQSFVYNGQRAGYVSYTDDLYRLSDFNNYRYVAGQRYDAYRIAPYFSDTRQVMVFYDSARKTWLPPTPPPPPAGYVPAATVRRDGEDLPLALTNAAHAVTTRAISSGFSADYAGNRYRVACDQTAGGVPANCALQKHSPSGQLLWEHPAGNRQPASVEYISSDNARIVLRHATGDRLYDVLDNQTGSVLLSFVNSDRSFAQDNISIYLGVFQDRLAYVRQTVAGTSNTSKYGAWELRFYDMISGATTSAGVIKTYRLYLADRRPCNCSTGYETTSITNAAPKAVVSSDGKLILANFFSNVLVYDMVSGVKQADIRTQDAKNYNINGGDPVSSSESSCSDSCSSDIAYVDSIALTEDAQVKVVYHYNSTYSSDTTFQDVHRYTVVTIRTDADPSGSAYSYGQLTDGETMADGDLSVRVRFDADTYSESASVGLGFRIRDHQSLYRAEVAPSGVQLVQIVDGRKTVLQAQPYPIHIGVDYELSVHLSGNRVRVSMQGIPIIDVTDDAFASGEYGPYAEAPYAALHDFRARFVKTNAAEADNVAIVNRPIRYATSFSDPEGDSAIPALARWTFTNIAPQKFLDAEDGASDPPGTNTYSGATVSSPYPALTRVGLYRVDFREPDDPAPPGYQYPDDAFKDYRKDSDPSSRVIVVHRSPVARFSLSLNADGTVAWNDTSYDPDRWLSPANYSNEATGIDYRATRGIVERKYAYVTPSGTTVEEKLTNPPETGTYAVRLAVKDEYGAWSDWAEQTIGIAKAAPPNTPPVAGFTISAASTWRGAPVMIASTAHDAEDGSAAHLKHEYWFRNVTTGGPETLQSAARGAWTKAFNSLGTFEIRQVVTDSQGQTAQAVRTITVANRPPAADFDWQPTELWEGDTVTLRNRSVDPDGDPLTLDWTIRAPDGSETHASADALSLRPDRPGSYAVTLDVFDGTDRAARTQSIVCGALTIRAEVNHAPAWLERHAKQKHAPDDFYAGEAFMAVAVSAPAPVERAVAWIDTTGIDGRPLYASQALTAEPTEPVRFTGRLYDDRFISLREGLPSGLQEVHFRIDYRNGVARETAVRINIVGNGYGAFGVHRVQ